MGKTILAIDQGTTNTKALVVNERGEIVARASAPMEVRFPRSGWVEQDPEALWRTVRQAVDAALEQAADPDLSAVAVSNQRETVVMWERRDGAAVGPAVVWQCRRSRPICDRLRAAGHEETVRRKAGLTIDPMFAGTKMRWLLESTQDGAARAERGELCLGTVDSWVLWKLTGGAVHSCDATNASRTLLTDTRHLAWDEELLAIVGVPRAALPSIHASSECVGQTVALGRLPAGVPVASLIGDSHAALFGQAGFQTGAIKATYGTGSSLMTPTSTFVTSNHGLSSTVAWARRGEAPVFALEGNIVVTGAAVQWLYELLGLKDGADGVAALARQADGSDGVYLVPAFAGLGAPHWAASARGMVTGLTRGSGAPQVARATIDSIAYQIRDVFDAMGADAGEPLKVLLADGGASRNDRLMQFQADILGCAVLRNTSADVSALGAAYLAGLATGVWENEAAIAALPRGYDRFEPKMDAAERARLYEGWQQAVARATAAATQGDREERGNHG
jgi:glycerol kinase